MEFETIIFSTLTLQFDPLCETYITCAIVNTAPERRV
jgi:hypothetical protein